MIKYSERIVEAEDEKITLTIEISNLTSYQAKELKNLLYAMDLAGNLGCSRDFECFVDGDGGFRPKVLINGEDKKKFEFKKGVDFDNGKSMSFDFD